MTALVFAVLLGFMWLAWRTLIAFLFSIFFAYLLEGPVDYFGRRFRLTRAKSIAITYFAIFGTLIILGFIFGGHITAEVQRLSQQLPNLSEQLSKGELIRNLGSRRGWKSETVESLQAFFNQHRTQIVSTVESYFQQALTEIERMWWLLLVPILAIFFLKDGEKLRNDIVQMFTRPQHKRLISILVSELNQMLGHFLRAQLALAGLAMLVITLGLAAMRVPYGYALGPIAGALEFIPVMGPIIGGAIVLVVAFAANYHHLVWVLVFLLIWRGIQDYVTSPRIMGGKLEMHPLAVLFGILAGGEVGGVIGVFLSIPVLAAIRIAWRTYNASHEPESIMTPPEIAAARHR
jgi:predicted PurR-regulated permease PerM